MMKGEPYHLGFARSEVGRLPRPGRLVAVPQVPRSRVRGHRSNQRSGDGQHHHDRAAGLRTVTQPMEPRLLHRRIVGRVGRRGRRGHRRRRSRQRRWRLDPCARIGVRLGRSEAEQGSRQPGPADRRSVGRRDHRRLRHAQRPRHRRGARRDLRLRARRPVHRSALRPTARSTRSAPIPASCASVCSIDRRSCRRIPTAKQRLPLPRSCWSRSAITSTTARRQRSPISSFQDRFVTVRGRQHRPRSADHGGHPRPPDRRGRPRARQRLLRRDRQLGVGCRLPAHRRRAGACGAARCCRGGIQPTAAPVTTCC